MPNATAEAPARANKARQRAQGAPSPAPTNHPAAAEGAHPDPHEYTVAMQAQGMLRELVESSSASSAASLYGSELTHQALRQVEGLIAGEPDFPGSTAFHAAAGMVAGALAIDQVKKPDEIGHHAQLLQVLALLESGSLSYGFVEEPCEGLAAGLKAAARPFRKPPRPPIRRVEDGYSPLQLKVTLEFVAGLASTQNEILMMAQANPEPWECALLVDAARIIALQMGGAADTAIGGQILGPMERWNYGPNFFGEPAQEGAA